MSRKPAPAVKKPPRKPNQPKVTTKRTLRVKKTLSHRTFKLSKNVRSNTAPLPGAFKLVRLALSLLYANKRLFLGITAVHVLLSVIFVRGFGISDDLVRLKQGLIDLFGEDANQLQIAVALFGQVATSAGTQASEAAGVYQMFLMLIASLAIIWALRQVLARQKITVKDAYYKGQHPVIPFLLVLLVIGLQLIPALIGNTLYATAAKSGLLVTGIEQLLALIIFLLLVLLSFYMIISSTFALYISTLPDMTPMRALRSARELVLNRRLSIALRVIALPLMLLVFSMITIVPLIIFVPLLVEPVFFVMSSLGLLIVHAYMYNLYRSLL